MCHETIPLQRWSVCESVCAAPPQPLPHRERGQRCASVISRLIRRGDAERLVKVGQQIVDGLDANREPDEVRRDAGRELLLVVQLRVCGAGWMNNQRLGVADIGQQREEFAPS